MQTHFKNTRTSTHHRYMYLTSRRLNIYAHTHTATETYSYDLLDGGQLVCCERRGQKLTHCLPLTAAAAATEPLPRAVERLTLIAQRTGVLPRLTRSGLPINAGSLVTRRKRHKCSPTGRLPPSLPAHLPWPVAMELAREPLESTCVLLLAAPRELDGRPVAAPTPVPATLECLFCP